MPLLAGARDGRYEIVSPLGAGGMGEVYRARDPQLGRDVALKVIGGDEAPDAPRLHDEPEYVNFADSDPARNLAAHIHIDIGDVEKGFAEADPTLDVEGIDSAHKLVDRFMAGVVNPKASRKPATQQPAEAAPAPVPALAAA